MRGFLCFFSRRTAIMVMFPLVLGACKSQRMQVNPGAYVTVDGTKDGLSNIQREFKGAERTSQGVMVTLASDVSFAINSSYLSASAKAELDRLANALEDYPSAALIVEGHTDATGTADYNLWLSAKRAESVRDYLVSKGIGRERFQVKGEGQAKPVAPNNTAEGRKKNRRVEITIVE